MSSRLYCTHYWLLHFYLTFCIITILPLIEMQERIWKKKRTVNRIDLGEASSLNGCVWASTLWARTAMNLYVSTGLLACPFAHLLVPLTHFLALHCSLRSTALIRLLNHLWESEWLNDSKQPGFVPMCFGLFAPTDYWRILRDVHSKRFRRITTSHYGPE